MVKKLPVVPAGKAGSAAEAPAHINWREKHPVITDVNALSPDVVLYCPEGAIVQEEMSDTLSIKLDLCKGCGICAAVSKGITMVPEFDGPKGIFPVRGDK